MIGSLSLMEVASVVGWLEYFFAGSILMNKMVPREALDARSNWNLIDFYGLEILQKNSRFSLRYPVISFLIFKTDFSVRICSQHVKLWVHQYLLSDRNNLSMPDLSRSQFCSLSGDQHIQLLHQIFHTTLNSHIDFYGERKIGEKPSWHTRDYSSNKLYSYIGHAGLEPPTLRWTHKWRIDDALGRCFKSVEHPYYPNYNRVI